MYSRRVCCTNRRRKSMGRTQKCVNTSNKSEVKILLTKTNTGTRYISATKHLHYPRNYLATKGVHFWKHMSCYIWCKTNKTNLYSHSLSYDESVQLSDETESKLNRYDKDRFINSIHFNPHEKS